MNFRYAGYDKKGNAVSGTIEGKDEAAAREQVSAKGVFVTEFVRSGGGGPEAGGGTDVGQMPRYSGKHLGELVSFTRQLSVLVSTGTPIADALRAVERQAGVEKFRATVKKLRGMLDDGASLAEAMGHFPRDFDPVMRSLVAAGEASGTLDTMLNRLARLVRQQQAVRKAIGGAMVYPAVLLFISIGVLAVMLFVVVPRFSGMFEALNAPLPTTTELLLTLSGFTRSYWWAIVPGVIAAGFGFVAWQRSSHGRRVRDRVMVRLPLFGELVRSLATARFARLLGTLLEAKLPLLDSLELAEQSMSNCLYRDLIARSRHAVVEGETFASAFASSDLVSPSMVEAIRNGESSARLDQVLNNLSEHLDEDNAVAIKALTQTIEPVIVLTMGLLIGFVAVSMFLPLFDLTSMAGH